MSSPTSAPTSRNSSSLERAQLRMLDHELQTVLADELADLLGNERRALLPDVLILAPDGNRTECALWVPLGRK